MTANPNIPNQDRLADYTATPLQTNFAVNWPVYYSDGEDPKADLNVEVAGTILAQTDFDFGGTAITGLTGVYSGGTITLHTPAATGQRVTIWSQRDPRRIGSFLEGRSLPFSELDKVLNDMVVQLRDLELLSKRGVHVSITDYIDGTDPENILNGFAAQVATVTAESALAQGAATTVSAALTIIQTYGAHKGANNIFDTMPANIVAAIQARNFGAAGYLDTYQAIAEAAGGAWIYPPGEYHWNATRSLPEGFRLIGISRDPVSGTVIFPGGAVGAWGGEQLNANGTNQVEGYSLEKAYFQVTQNGFRWNSATGGFDDTSGTQAYMMRPRVLDCGFNMDSVTRRTALQFNKCFDTHITDPSMNAFNIDMQFNGCDDTVLDGVYRSDLNFDTCLDLASQNTFGNTFTLENADLNQGFNNFVRSTQRKLILRNNHMELDGNRGANGSGGKMSAAIYIHGNSFSTIIEDNSMDLNFFADNWLKVDPSTNTYLVSAHNNVTASAHDAMGTVNFTSDMPVFNNSGGQTIIRHGGNGGDNSFPFNSIPVGDGDLALNCVVSWRPGKKGLTQVSYNPLCRGGEIALAPIAAQGSLIELSDFGTPIVGGTIDIYMLAYGSVAGQTVETDTRDGAFSIGTNTFTLALNSPDIMHVYAGAHPASGLKLWVWNDDTGHGGNAWIKAIWFVRS